jgi:hypothetical protein
MAGEVKPIRTKRDHEAALKEVERLWGAKAGTRDGDRLDVVATLIDAYEAEHYPMDPPDPIEAMIEAQVKPKSRQRCYVGEAPGRGGVDIHDFVSMSGSRSPYCPRVSA